MSDVQAASFTKRSFGGAVLVFTTPGIIGEQSVAVSQSARQIRDRATKKSDGSTPPSASRSRAAEDQRSHWRPAVILFELMTTGFRWGASWDLEAVGSHGRPVKRRGHSKTSGFGLQLAVHEFERACTSMIIAERAYDNFGQSLPLKRRPTDESTPVVPMF
ncbi:hypothetical protein ELI24_08480 [Rhizobium ruizarguesonis]|uniref:hypothetical protein n=1 Tax=Rhizobium ruizarguesonis TaxID=2081791 RepID=UPI00102F533D|nr:hypothetical protein [Rhizobium ruizarguesonis]TAV98417.1 hypothetical protein ELI24_08480 [Rhizobium ruizarguesonis]